MVKNLSSYNSLVFDCDGVVLDSNKVKTEAFYKTAIPFGEEAATKLVDYHKARGGISRYKKFEWFLSNVLSNKTDVKLDNLVDNYAHFVIDGLMNCDVVQGLEELRNKTKHASWFIVSGGDETELRKVFKARNLEVYFDGGIFGSPDSKDIILKRELDSKNIKPHALFLGDSKYDFEASVKAGLDFVFLNYWTEVEDWKHFCKSYSIHTSNSILDLK